MSVALDNSKTWACRSWTLKVGRLVLAVVVSDYIGEEVHWLFRRVWASVPQQRRKQTDTTSPHAASLVLYAGGLQRKAALSLPTSLLLSLASFYNNPSIA